MHGYAVLSTFRTTAEPSPLATAQPWPLWARAVPASIARVKTMSAQAVELLTINPMASAVGFCSENRALVRPIGECGKDRMVGGMMGDGKNGRADSCLERCVAECLDKVGMHHRG